MACVAGGTAGADSRSGSGCSHLMLVGPFVAAVVDDTPHCAELALALGEPR